MMPTLSSVTLRSRNTKTGSEYIAGTLGYQHLSRTNTGQNKSCLLSRRKRYDEKREIKYTASIT